MNSSTDSATCLKSSETLTQAKRHWLTWSEPKCWIPAPSWNNLFLNKQKRTSTTFRIHLFTWDVLL